MAGIIIPVVLLKDGGYAKIYAHTISCAQFIYYKDVKVGSSISPSDRVQYLSIEFRTSSGHGKETRYYINPAINIYIYPHLFMTARWGDNSYVIKPLDTRTLREIFLRVKPDFPYSEKDMEGFYPNVENEPWFSRWIVKKQIPETIIPIKSTRKVIRPVTYGAPELLWPFLQNVDKSTIKDRLAMFMIECNGNVKFPLDLEMVENILLSGKKIKLFIGSEIVREGELAIRQLEDCYELI